MNAITLPRITPVAQSFSALNSLATLASNQLGYAYFGDRLRSVKLVQTMCNVGVAPFVESAVKHYKVVQFLKVNVTKPLVWLSVAVVLAGVGLLFRAFAIQQYVLIAGTFMSWFVAALLFHEGAALWQTCRLKDYGAFVPPAILEKALELSKHVDSNSIMVDYLSAEDLRDHRAVEMERRIAEDPFLYVTDRSGKRQYFAVWDEPDFTL